jgi:hypothetical protein
LLEDDIESLELWNREYSSYIEIFMAATLSFFGHFGSSFDCSGYKKSSFDTPHCSKSLAGSQVCCSSFCAQVPVMFLFVNSSTLIATEVAEDCNSSFIFEELE